MTGHVGTIWLFWGFMVCLVWPSLLALFHACVTARDTQVPSDVRDESGWES
jgi:hypothetical protein